MNAATTITYMSPYVTRQTDDEMLTKLKCKIKCPLKNKEYKLQYRMLGYCSRFSYPNQHRHETI